MNSGIVVTNAMLAMRHASPLAPPKYGRICLVMLFLDILMCLRKYNGAWLCFVGSRMAQKMQGVTQKTEINYEYDRYLFAPSKSRKHFNKRCLMQIYC